MAWRHTLTILRATRSVPKGREEVHCFFTHVTTRTSLAQSSEHSACKLHSSPQGSSAPTASKVRKAQRFPLPNPHTPPAPPVEFIDLPLPPALPPVTPAHPLALQPALDQPPPPDPVPDQVPATGTYTYPLAPPVAVMLENTELVPGLPIVF